MSLPQHPGPAPTGMGRGGGNPQMRGFARDRSVSRRRLSRATLRRILAFARPHRRALAVFLVLITLEAGAGALPPLLFKHLIDDGITQGDTRLVVLIAAAVAAIALLSAGLAVADRWVSSRIGEGLILDLRTAVFDHVQRMPLAFFSRTRTGALVQRLNGDVLGAQQAFTSTLQNVVSNALTVVFVLAAMLSMSWRLTLLSLVLLPLFVLPARWFGPRIAAVTHESYELNAQAAQTMQERSTSPARTSSRSSATPRASPPPTPSRHPGSGTSASSARCTARGSASASRRSPPSRPRSSTASEASPRSRASSPSASSSRSRPTSAGSTARSPRCPTCRSTS